MPSDGVENTYGTNSGEEIYDSHISSEMFIEERKGCRKWTRGSGELLYIGQHILKDSKTRRKNLVIG